MSLEQIGQILKKKRMQNRWTLKTVSKISRIRVEKLKAIEEGDESNFAAKIHTRGFIKIYAKVLSLDAGPLLEMYKAEDPITNYPIVSIEKLNKNVRSLFTITNIAISLTVVCLTSFIVWTKFSINTHEKTVSRIPLSQLQSATSFKINEKSLDFVPVLHSPLPERFPLLDLSPQYLLSNTNQHNIDVFTASDNITVNLQKKLAQIKSTTNTTMNNAILKKAPKIEEKSSHPAIEKLKSTFLNWFK